MFNIYAKNSEKKGRLASSSLLSEGFNEAIDLEATCKQYQKNKQASKKRRLLKPKIFLPIIFVLVGLCMILYPFASDYLNRLEQAKVTQSLTKTIETTSEEDLSNHMKQAQEYNERLLAGSTYVVDPFDPDTQSVTDEDYSSCLNLNGDGVMGNIIIPSININLSIYHGTDGKGMNTGVGHVTNTSLPVGGSSTHSVLAGHTGLPSAVIFDKLTQLKNGDYFIIQVLGEDHAYKVTSTEVVLPEDTSSLGVKQGQDLVTLVTCTPYGVNSHRLLVHAERCEIPQDWLDRKASGDTSLPFPFETSANSFPPFLIGVFVAFAIIICFCAFKLFNKFRNSKRKE